MSGGRLEWWECPHPKDQMEYGVDFKPYVGAPGWALLERCRWCLTSWWDVNLTRSQADAIQRALKGRRWARDLGDLVP